MQILVFCSNWYISTKVEPNLFGIVEKLKYHDSTFETESNY